MEQQGWTGRNEAPGMEQELEWKGWSCRDAPDLHPSLPCCPSQQVEMGAPSCGGSAALARLGTHSEQILALQLSWVLFQIQTQSH